MSKEANSDVIESYDDVYLEAEEWDKLMSGFKVVPQLSDEKAIREFFAKK